MSDIIIGKRAILTYDKRGAESVLFVASDTNFPDKVWVEKAPLTNLLVPPDESKTYPVKIQGNVYISDNTVVRNKLVLGETQTWSKTVPNYDTYKLLSKGSLYVQGKVIASDGFSGDTQITSQSFNITQKSFQSIAYTDTVLSMGTTAGRIKITNIKTYDMLTRKKYTLQNSNIKFSTTNENEVSSIFMNVIKYTNSSTSPFITILSINPGVLEFELTNFANSGDNLGELELNFLII